MRSTSNSHLSDIEEKRATLLRVPWIGLLDEEWKHKLICNLQHRELPDGDILAHRGSEIPGFVIVHKGTVELGSLRQSGREHVLIRCGRGQSFGLVPVIQGRPAILTSRANGAASVLIVPRELVMEVLLADSRIAIALLHHVADRARRLFDFIQGQFSLQPVQRLAYWLLLAVDAYGPGGGRPQEFTLGFSQEEIATMLGVSRQTLGIHLKILERSGAIALAYRSIRILDPAQLSALVEP